MGNIILEKQEMCFKDLNLKVKGLNDYTKANYMKEKLVNIDYSKPTLIMATGGSRVVAEYLKLFLEQISFFKGIVEVIEPRDYFHKKNINAYGNLIVISASGKTNGVKSSLEDFKGNKYLIVENELEMDNVEIIPWGNGEKAERSFISLVDTLEPITYFLDIMESRFFNVDKSVTNKVNERIDRLFFSSKELIDNLDLSCMSDNSLIQVMSGYETKPSATLLESSLIETGIASVVVHDKGDYCHGRSNLIYRNPDSLLLYLTHKENELDKLLLNLLNEEYKNIIKFDIKGYERDWYYQEYYLLLQMYYLCKRLGEIKNIDVSSPTYNPKLVKKLYPYRGEM